MSNPEYFRAAANAAQAVVAAVEGRPFDATSHALDAVLDFVTLDVAHDLLDDAARKRANAIADIAELAKFGPKP